MTSSSFINSLHFSSLLSPPQTTNMAAMSQTSLLTPQHNQSDFILLNLMSVSGKRKEAGNLHRWGHGSSLTNSLWDSAVSLWWPKTTSLVSPLVFPSGRSALLQDDQVGVRGEELEVRGSSVHVRRLFKVNLTFFKITERTDVSAGRGGAVEVAAPPAGHSETHHKI